MNNTIPTKEESLKALMEARDLAIKAASSNNPSEHLVDLNARLRKIRDIGAQRGMPAELLALTDTVIEEGQKLIDEYGLNKDVNPISLVTGNDRGEAIMGFRKVGGAPFNAPTTGKNFELVVYESGEALLEFEDGSSMSGFKVVAADSRQRGTLLRFLLQALSLEIQGGKVEAFDPFTGITIDYAVGIGIEWVDGRARRLHNQAEYDASTAPKVRTPIHHFV